MRVKVVERRARHPLLEEPRHTPPEVSVESVPQESTHVPEQGREEYRSEYRRGVVRRRRLLEHLERGVTEAVYPADAEHLREHRDRQRPREGAEDAVS